MSIPRLFDLGLLGLSYVALAPEIAWAAPPESPQSTSPDDALAGYRERFKRGMQRYTEGAPAEAIGLWEPIYRELGTERGYRLAYDLGVAYAELGDATPAAERFEEFLAEVDRRRARGEALAALVEKDEADSRGRMATLLATKGRIHIAPGMPPQSVRVDSQEPRLSGFTAWVTPGEHTLVFAPGTPEQHTDTRHVGAGELVDVPPWTPLPVRTETPPIAPPTDAVPGAPAVAGDALPRSPSDTNVDSAPRHPYSWVVVAIGGGLTLAAAITAVPLENHARTLRNRYAGELPSIPATDRHAFETARTSAYVTMGTAAALGAATGALAAWYFLGTSRHEAFVRLSAVPLRGGAVGSLTGQF